MKKLLCFLIIMPIAAIAAEPECETSSFNEVLSYYFSNEFSDLNNRLLEVHYENYSSEDDFLDLIVIAQEALRGGSDSLVTIDVFKGKKSGLCSLPETFSLNIQVSEPYKIDIRASEYYPVFDVDYTYFASNAFGDFKTNSPFVSDLRREEYGYRDGNYEVTSKKILKCIVCAPEK